MQAKKQVEIKLRFLAPSIYGVQRFGLGDVAAFEIRQPVTAAKFINKSSLFILLLGFIRRQELESISELNVENIFVTPPYCQTACCRLAFSVPFLIFAI